MEILIEAEQKCFFINNCYADACSADFGDYCGCDSDNNS